MKGICQLVKTGFDKEKEENLEWVRKWVKGESERWEKVYGSQDGGK